MQKALVTSEGIRLYMYPRPLANPRFSMLHWHEAKGCVYRIIRFTDSVFYSTRIERDKLFVNNVEL